MERRALADSRVYFVEVLTPNRNAYFDGPITFANALNFATSLFHFHEWLWIEFRVELESRLNASLPSSKAFWAKVEATDHGFGYIKDVANASKHVSLTRATSTGVTNISQASFEAVGYGMGSYGVGRYGGPNFMVLDEDQRISFDECASRMFDYWGRLLDDLDR